MSGEDPDLVPAFADRYAAAIRRATAGYMHVGEGGMNWLGGSASGAMAGLDWDVGFELGDADDDNDAERYGFTVGYAIGSGRAYVHYEDLQYDDDMNESTNLLFGYSQSRLCRWRCASG